jgi:hypothetical protein
LVELVLIHISEWFSRRCYIYNTSFYTHLKQQVEIVSKHFSDWSYCLTEFLAKVWPVWLCAQQTKCRSNQVPIVQMHVRLITKCNWVFRATSLSIEGQSKIYNFNCRALSFGDLKENFVNKQYYDGVSHKMLSSNLKNE